MDDIVLYCKSFHVDVFRVKRLAESVQRFNVERLPFFVSVPAADLPLFQEMLGHLDVRLLSDEDIILANPGHDLARLAAMPGNHSQQVVKSEFWRLGLCENYLCIDSDAVFIRDFGVTDFLTDEGIPYTTIDESRDLLESALARGKDQVAHYFQQEAKQAQTLFGRRGRNYGFGPLPLVWSRRVWEDLDREFLRPRQMTFADAIESLPIETRWYGEALLKYRSIPLFPCQALFKVYHYAWQMRMVRGLTLKPADLPRLYLGVIYQSAWERELDWPREAGSWLSRLARRVRRRLGLS